MKDQNTCALSRCFMVGRRFVKRAVLPFPLIAECSSEARENQTIVSDFDGTLLGGCSSFPYFMLIAFEAGSYLRAIALLTLAPIAWVIYHFISEASGIKVLIFVSFAGLKMKNIQIAARAVLPKFYADDLHPEAWQIFSSFGKRYILTANPRIMVEAFATEHLGADEVIGTELEVSKYGRATGFVAKEGMLIGVTKANALLTKFGSSVPDVGMGDRETDWPFMALCKESYVVPAGPEELKNVKKVQLARPVIFHDGRLVCLPTPLNALLTFLWIPVGFLLAILRIAAGSLLPMSMTYYAYRTLGVRLVARGIPPVAVEKGSKLGVLFVCSHRSLLDPIFLSSVLGRRVSAVTYSISRVSEFLSPIKTVALSRNREKDACNIRNLLEEGDLAICPEGTTCREPFLLRFSSLFAELTDQIVPVAMNNRMSMFHGTTATGWKGMDPFFFFMNPSPVYEVNFVNQLPMELTCSGGKSSHEVANYIQRVLAGRLGFECTTFTRKHKYNWLAGSDGSIAPLHVTSSGAFTCSDPPGSSSVTSQLLRV